MTEGTMRFQIGDVVWRVSWNSREDWVTCPDCGGTCRLRVIFHDGTEASIHCANCAVGYDPPRGVVELYTRSPIAHQHTITGFEVGPDGVRWRLDGTECSWQIADDADVYATKDLATERATAESVRKDNEERAQVYRKEKDTRTWAWNASYHRRELKRAQDQVAYHAAKLDVAAHNAKSKEIAAP